MLQFSPVGRGPFQNRADRPLIQLRHIDLQRKVLCSIFTTTNDTNHRLVSYAVIGDGWEMSSHSVNG